jgi:hypothetical protein
MFQKLGYHISGKLAMPLTRLLVPDDPLNPDNTTWTSIVKAEAIWEALLHHGQQHFSQADQTPFIAGPISAYIGPFEFNEYLKQILQGTFNIDSIMEDIEVRDIVKAMCYDNPDSPLKFNCSLSIDDLKTGFINAKESTASSPTRMHYGIWKSLLHDDELFLPYAMMIQFAFRWGAPPKQWSFLVQPLIEKDAGNPKVIRLRRISLVDSTMNMGFHIIYRHQMMKAAEHNNSLAAHQYGHSGHMAIGAVLMKCLSYDMAQLLQAILLTFNCDTMACYNQMVPSMCISLATREGVDKEPNNAHLELAQNMEYHMKSAFGVLPQSFKNSAFLTLLNMWQGSAAVSALWGLVSSLLFHVLQQHYQPTQFQSPDPDIFTERHGKAFVDDTTLWMISMQATLPIICQEMQIKAQDWERNLKSASGMAYNGNGPRPAAQS